MWYIYILECSDKTFYTGITKDLKRRVLEHNTTNKGAKYTKGRRPVQLVYSSKIPNIAQALKEELRIKRLSRKEKLKNIKSKI